VSIRRKTTRWSSIAVVSALLIAMSVTVVMAVEPTETVLAWGETGSADGQFNEQVGIVVGPTGNIWNPD